VALAVHLLGTPRVTRDGAAVPPPRGNKGWGVLAYLLSAGPTPRTRLAGLLFPEADDPLAALRWTLHGLRQLLGTPDALRGDPVAATLPAGSFVDLTVLRSGSWHEALDVPGVGHELLESMSFASCPAFDAWLLGERRHLACVSQSILREATLARLGAGDGHGALETASRLAASAPLDEAAQELHVRALLATGDLAGARTRRDAAVELIRREIGVEPGPDLLAACDREEPAPATDGTSRALADLGFASVLAGAYDTGEQTIRAAIAEARRTGDRRDLLRALVLLLLVNTYMSRGGGEAANAAAYEAILLAEDLGTTRPLATAYRQLALGEIWRGHPDRAQRWAALAWEAAGDDEAERAVVAGVRGTILLDTGDYPAALADLERSLAGAPPERDPYNGAYVLATLGRLRLLRGEADEAEEPLTRALAIARDQWLAFRPWPEALRAEVDLVRGDLDAAQARYERAYALSCQLSTSPCWQSLSGRGLGLVAAARGDVSEATRWLDDARRCGTRLSGSYQWVRCYALDALCGHATAHGLPGAPAWIATLEEWAGRRGLRELLARAYLHRAALGDGAALAVARELAVTIDNPALHARLEAPAAV
jgi:DNA-binding SARP family transcriptional activator